MDNRYSSASKSAGCFTFGFCCQEDRILHCDFVTIGVKIKADGMVLSLRWGCREHFVSGCWHSSGRDCGRYPRECWLSTLGVLHPGVIVMWYGHIRDLFTTAGGLLADGKTPYERRFGEPLKRPIIPFRGMVEYYPISARDYSSDMHWLRRESGREMAPCKRSV